MKRPISSATPQLHVAAYCRIDAGGEEQNTELEAQKAYYTEKINANPDWSMAGIFADIGSSRSERPEFKKLLHECRQKKVDLILVKSISRFARDYLDCLDKVRKLQELGVAVEFEKENVNTLDPNSDWYISIMDTIAKAESESVSRHICNGCFPCMMKCRHTKGTWKKTIRLPGCPEKTIKFRME